LPQKGAKSSKSEGAYSFERLTIFTNLLKKCGGIFELQMLLFCDFCAFLRLSQLRNSG